MDEIMFSSEEIFVYLKYYFFLWYKHMCTNICTKKSQKRKTAMKKLLLCQMLYVFVCISLHLEFSSWLTSLITKTDKLTCEILLFRKRICMFIFKKRNLPFLMIIKRNTCNLYYLNRS